MTVGAVLDSATTSKQHFFRALSSQRWTVTPVRASSVILCRLLFMCFVCVVVVVFLEAMQTSGRSLTTREEERASSLRDITAQGSQRGPWKCMRRLINTRCYYNDDDDDDAVGTLHRSGIYVQSFEIPRRKISTVNAAAEERRTILVVLRVNYTNELTGDSDTVSRLSVELVLIPLRSAADKDDKAALRGSVRRNRQQGKSSTRFLKASPPLWTKQFLCRHLNHGWRPFSETHNNDKLLFKNLSEHPRAVCSKRGADRNRCGTGEWEMMLLLEEEDEEEEEEEYEEECVQR
ncbi:hypothetical protein JOB18_035673 [Solea senegalensis]|uniref:Uncharacterized protein n=1 Tax=Solea senegalensis TaxID=28829 RepID=A0AAV6PWK7_SOLSE|nr:hypothetical protein JOB18_035673 [Solea senegalensis]